MEPIHCPLVGTGYDPQTHFMYPSEENICGSLRGPQSPDFDRQEQFCLSPNFLRCPYFEPAPRATRWTQTGSIPSARRNHPRVGRWSALFVLLAAVGLIVFLAVFLSAGRAVEGSRVFLPSPTWQVTTVPAAIPASDAASSTPAIVPVIPTWTQTMIPRPTAPATATATAGSMSSPAETIRLTPTGEPSPTLGVESATSTLAPATSLPTRRPSPSPTRPATTQAHSRSPLSSKYPKPQLSTPDDHNVTHKATVLLSWQPVAETLSVNEVYVVEFWKEGSVPSGAWTRQNSYMLNAGAIPSLGEGVVMWHVMVAQVEGDRIVASLSEPSDTWEFGWYH